MPFNINQFIAQQKVFGLGKANAFEIYLSSPTIQDNITAKVFSRLYAKAGTIPGVSYNSLQVPFMGMNVSVPAERVYADWTVTIVNDRQFILRNILENWGKEVSNKDGLVEKTGISVGGFLNIGAGEGQTKIDLSRVLKDLWVIQYSPDVLPVPVATYFLRDAYPVEVSPISLSWEPTENTQDYSVTFKYQYFDKVSLNEIPGEIRNMISGGF